MVRYGTLWYTMVWYGYHTETAERKSTVSAATGRRVDTWALHTTQQLAVMLNIHALTFPRDENNLA